MAQRKKRFLAMILLAVFAVVSVLPQVCFAQDETEPGLNAGFGDKSSIAIAAAVVVSVACLAAGIAVARVGAAALGAASERPELLMRSLIFVALAEGIAVLGLLMGFMLWLLIRK